MNIMPKLLYLFQNLPLPPPVNLFTRLKRLFVRFLWNNRRATQLSLLYLPDDRGGLKLPSLVLLGGSIKNNLVLLCRKRCSSLERYGRSPARSAPPSIPVFSKHYNPQKQRKKPYCEKYDCSVAPSEKTSERPTPPLYFQPYMR